MYKIPANTLFIGKKVVFVPECHSTNTLAFDLLDNSSIIEGTVVIAHRQTAGRGQRGNQWIAEPGKNLTLSFILRPTFLPVADQFELTKVVALAAKDLLSEVLPNKNVRIKWPNDVMIGDRKVCGILIENQIRGSSVQSSIAGIGLNVNQTILPVDTATSMIVEAGSEYNLEVVFDLLCAKVERRYLMLKQNRRAELEHDYLDALFWKNEERTFEANGVTFSGAIRGITREGKLLVESNGERKSFEMKEIKFLLGSTRP